MLSLAVTVDDEVTQPLITLPDDPVWDPTVETVRGGEPALGHYRPARPAAEIIPGIFVRVGRPATDAVIKASARRLARRSRR